MARYSTTTAGMIWLMPRRVQACIRANGGHTKYRLFQIEQILEILKYLGTILLFRMWI